MRRKVVIAAAFAVVAATIPLLAPSFSGVAAAAPSGLDGTSAATAGASCWGIKQEYPSSATGLYWLNNAALGEPDQFYCDMTTDGGGWVLVGRGREGWSFTHNGQGFAPNVRNIPTGPDAFSPVALPSATINKLLNNTSPTALPDGIRVRRAQNTTGTTWQEIRVKPSTATMNDWSWSFDGGILLNSIKVGAITYQGSNTRDTSTNWANQTTNGLNGVNNSQRLWTYEWASHNNQAGFTYGKGVRGNSSATSYLWEFNGEDYAIPFTQVWVRPQIANSAGGFTSIPDAGYPAQAQPFALKQKTEPVPWGVVGLNRTDEEQFEPWNTPVAVVKPLGDRVFVGGRFAAVQQGNSGTPITQPFLAAFERSTGNWIPSFLPQLDGRVWDMVFTPDNKIIIGGDFTNVNGVPNTQGLAKIDPITGAVDTTFKATLGRVDSSGYRPVVRTLDIQDGFLYAGGKFNRLTGGTWAQITVSSLIKVQLASGTPVQAFKPVPAATVIDLDASPQGDRVHVAGYFATMNGSANGAYFATVSSADGSLIPGQGNFQPSVGSSAKYQQTVTEYGNFVYVGGSEHDLQKYTRDTRTFVDAHNARQGGDFQDSAVMNGKLYAGCHCFNYLYEGSNYYTTPQAYRDVDSITAIGQFDLGTFNHDEEWNPVGLKGDDHNEGVWAIEPDTGGTNCLWVGGDLVRRGWSGDANEDWIGNFGKFCPEDSTVPTTPSNLNYSVSGTDRVLTWSGSTDDSGSVEYLVYRNDRVIATTSQRTYTDPGRTGTDRYTVRAADARRNLSASTNVITAVPVVSQLITAGSAWKYADNGTAQDPTWKTEGYGDAAWSQGNAQLGWGDGDEATVIGAGKPVTSYFRKTFSLASTAGIGSLDLGLIRDDGAVVYVNGVEVTRQNMPAGQITNTTLASAYASGNEESTWQHVIVPVGLFHAGTNTVAVELHQADATNADGSFDLSLTAQGKSSDATAPSAPTTSATGLAGAVPITWTASTDNVGVVGYVISRDGQPVAVAGPNATSYTDGGLGYSETHQYGVVAFDANGNLSGGNTVGVTTQANPTLITYKSTWKYAYDGNAQPSNWAQGSFDDSTWISGVGELGYGDGDETTVISTAPTPRPLVGYFRKTINIADPAAFSSVVIDTIRDDGAVVYVNGVEVGRDNLPAGTIDNTTGALTALSTRAQETTPYTVSVPSSAFVAGANTISVEVHNSDKWSGDFSFDLRATGQF